jgi:hypothetical protein
VRRHSPRYLDARQPTGDDYNALLSITECKKGEAGVRSARLVPREVGSKETIPTSVNLKHQIGTQGRNGRQAAFAAPSSIIALFRVINQYFGNLPPMPGVFSDYLAPVVRDYDGVREMIMMRWRMPPPPKFRGPPVTNIRNTSSPTAGAG